jgi:iron complex transport system permease protein
MTAATEPVRRGVLLGGLALLVALLFVGSLAAGRAPMPLIETVARVLAREPSLLGLVLVEIRLPRALLGLMVGATLGLAGAALQGLTRNPLAEPGLVGVSGSAALGAVLVFYFGLAGAFPPALPLGGMAGAAFGSALVLALAGRGASPLTLILAGVAVTSLAGALTSLALNLAPSLYAALEIVFWLLGSLADRSLDHVWLAAPFMVAGWVVLLSLGRPLDALSLGDEAARSLGFDIGRVGTRLVIGTALSVGAAVAVAGSIGFVGLVVPHLLRPLVAHRPSRLLVPSMLGGAALLLAADILVRLVSASPELQLGVVTALVGAPFFLALVLNARRAA